jgi:hypothetical protein
MLLAKGVRPVACGRPGLVPGSRRMNWAIGSYRASDQGEPGITCPVGGALTGLSPDRSANAAGEFHAYKKRLTWFSSTS